MLWEEKGPPYGSFFPTCLGSVRQMQLFFRSLFVRNPECLGLRELGEWPEPELA